MAYPGYDPDEFEMQQIMQQRQMAQRMGQMNPGGGKYGALAAVLGGLMASRGMSQSDERMRAISDRMRQRQEAEQTAFADLATAQPRMGIAPATPNDDEGNPMPGVAGESAPEFQQRRQQLARQLLMSRNPQMQQFAMQAMTPQKKDLLTLKEGEQAFERDPMTGALRAVAGAPKTEKPNLEALIIPGPDGKPMINPLAVQAKAQIAAAGRPPAQPKPPRYQIDAERGLRYDLDTGEATPLVIGGQPVGPKNKDMTDAQAKANLFGTRAQEADKIINGLAEQGIFRPSLIKQGADALPMVGNVAGMMANATQSSGQQQVEQAQRDFINAVLRRESGAVISPAEFDNARLQYFPQPNDKPETIRQKARAREIAIQGILAEVPGGKRSTPPGAAPNIDALLKKYGG